MHEQGPGPLAPSAGPPLAPTRTSVCLAVDTLAAREGGPEALEIGGPLNRLPGLGECPQRGGDMALVGLKGAPWRAQVGLARVDGGLTRSRMFAQEGFLPCWLLKACEVRRLIAVGVRHLCLYPAGAPRIVGPSCLSPTSLAFSHDLCPNACTSSLRRTVCPPVSLGSGPFWLIRHCRLYVGDWDEKDVGCNMSARARGPSAEP